ncbi:MAG: AAA family ATPase, partial [Dermatophilaceae bacterium]
MDEAAMAATTDLAHVVRYALTRGASVRLVGDDAQLASIAAGGVLRDIAATHGAVTLTELVRFTDPAEAAAGLAIRDGDPAGIGFYLDTHRVSVGDLTTVTDTAYTGWATDRAAGRDTIMLAPTRELVAQLNARAQRDRLTTDGADPLSAVVTLVDGTHACAGDLVITRRNDRRLRLWPTDWVSNGQRWTVRTVHDDGRLSVQDVANPRRRVTLPAEYVAEHVQLGYASTIHAAQGLTADTSHTVLTGTESRQQLYVALT